MLEVMAKAVGYKKFDKIYIKNTIYLPEEYFGYLENKIKDDKQIISSLLSFSNLSNKISEQMKGNKEDDKEGKN